MARVAAKSIRSVETGDRALPKIAILLVRAASTNPESLDTEEFEDFQGGDIFESINFDQKADAQAPTTMLCI